ncbi:MAG: malic enzyme-like NAD(P)-binding protein [Thiofilum sp.]|uniref:malic enzyme-like NAD(P)-binding protein n=1 Tax=Thiofilum sp. TaxID=2212733 RepID=UPI0025E28D00|nr:malic enzyme-like NAD(P)-binding protein [Thiofilum sp.]MBK8452814.1 malate dehydrogenase [Thiofilum sp.]
MIKDLRHDALQYHAEPKPGKIALHISKPTNTQRDLSLAYTPGVAEPVKAIAANPEDAYRYTSKGNLVAVISDGSAILGLGNLGALASKPVMEGKGVLFKRFADVDVFDIEVATQDVEEFITVVKNIAGTFGGINLEDISAPRCFEIEKRLQAMLDIPVFHDDQHGTAVIIAAGLINALEIQGKTIDQVKIVCLGAGAAGIASMNMLTALGAKKENLFMVDSKGIIHTERSDLNEYKAAYAQNTSLRTLADACTGADVFIGLSGPNLLTPEMLKVMADKPIVFALSNPNPEIARDLAMQTRDDLIMATGRSDYPNQINNVLGFPFLFRGALDVRAKCINTEMLVAAVHGLAKLAREPVPPAVLEAYNLESLEFGKEYFIPKPLDARLRERIPAIVSQAAIDSGVARLELLR